MAAVALPSMTLPDPFADAPVLVLTAAAGDARQPFRIEATQDERNQKMTDKQNSKAPNLIAYYVTEGTEAKKGQWTRIGAAWDHDDAKGITLQLDAIPLGFTGRVVLREPKPKQEPGAGA